MATTALNTIKNWFKTGLKPTQAQFWAWMDSFWHKGENIPISSIENLEDMLSEKADQEYVQGLAATIPVDRLTEETIDSYLGARLKPSNANGNGFFFRRNANKSVGYIAFNADTGNGAIATNGVGIDPTDNYAKSTYIAHFGLNYYIAKLRGNGALFTDRQLFIGTTAPGKDIEFVTGADIASGTTKFKILADGQLVIAEVPAKGSNSDKLLLRAASGAIKYVDFSTTQLKVIKPITVESYTLSANDLGALSLATFVGNVNIIVPSEANVSLPIGHTQSFRGVAPGYCSFITAQSGVSFDTESAWPFDEPIRNGVEFNLTKVGINTWSLVISDSGVIKTEIEKNVIFKGGDFDRDLEESEMGVTRYDYSVNGSKSFAAVFGNGDSIEFNLLEGDSANIQVPSTGMGKKTLAYLEKPIKYIGTDYSIINSDKLNTLVLNNEDFTFSLNRDTFKSGDELEIINYNAVNNPGLALADPGVVLPNQLKVWYNGDLYEMGDGIAIPMGKRALLKCIGINEFALNMS